MVQGQSHEEEDEGQGGLGTSPSDEIPQQALNRPPGAPMEDPDVEAFLRQAARIVLRLKGLAGSTREVPEEELNRDTA